MPQPNAYGTAQRSTQHVSSMHSPDQPRNVYNHRRTRPELMINTTHSKSAAAVLEPEITTPLSPPPPANLLHSPPSIPYKSSQRSLRSASHEKRHPPVSARGKQPAPADPAETTYSPHSYRDQERGDRDRFRADRDRDGPWADGRDVETFFENFSAVDMSNKENDLLYSQSESHPRRSSRTPPPLSRNGRGHRPSDSHDLSYSPRNVTRDSLLGNMLLSLDQFSLGQMTGGPLGGEERSMTGFAEPDVYDDNGGRGARPTTSTSRAKNAPVHHYSYSSDYEAPDDSSRMSRGRRSTSSSVGFQPNLGRIDSMRETANNNNNHERNGHGLTGSRPSHSRGARGSKSSSTNSIDVAGHAQVLGSQLWAHCLGAKRSSSFELARPQSFGPQSGERERRQPQHMQSQQQLQQMQQQQQQPWHFLEFSSHSLFASTADLDDYDDAAPTPTVPVGPRRLPTMPSMPSFPRSEPMAEPLSPVRSVHAQLERKRSNKSSRSTNTTATRQTYSSARLTKSRDAAPPLPGPVSLPLSGSDLSDSAPAPHVGYEKAKDAEPVHTATPNSAASQPKDKPAGFFRRMFGGSSKNTSPVVSAVDRTTAPSSLANSPLQSPAVATMPNASSSSSSMGPPAQPKNNASRQTQSSHGIQKKPSGFFRRRKKSVSVASIEPPPLPPILPPPTIAPAELPLAPPRRLEFLTPRPQPSPVTSLRKAMDPYLSGGRSSSPSPRAEDHSPSVYHTAVDEISDPMEQTLRSFSPDYEPDPKATIRSVPSELRSKKDNGPAAHVPRTRTPTRDRDLSKPSYGYERTGSFLHDDSDSDRSPPLARKEASHAAVESRSRSPTSAGRSTLAPIQTTNLPLLSLSVNSTIKDKKLDRLTQDSMSTVKSDKHESLNLPIEGVKTELDLKTRVSAASIPSVNVEADPSPKTEVPKNENPFDEPEVVVGEPTADDRAKAQKIFDGNEDFIPKDKAASWMGEEGMIRQRTLKAYIELYDFTNKNIVTCLRDVCNRLVLRAETQQVDRILVAFARRWCDCNPNHGFKSIDVIHTICYSIMLLNTDLHLADIEHKMTRSQFIKNTLTTIRAALDESAPEAFDRPSILPGRGSVLEERPVEHERLSFRNSFVRMPGRSGSALGEAPGELDDCGPLVKSPFDGSMKAWESQMELVLKDIYASIRDERLPLFGAEQVQEQHQASSGGLSVMSSLLKRSPSVLSKAPSENPSTRGRGPDSIRAGNSRWVSKSRSRPRGFGSAGFSSSRTSFDDGQSIWSPVESAGTWSRASLGRTHTTMSMDSFGSHFQRGDYQQSIGFANALSQAIIREDTFGSAASVASDDVKTTAMLEDDSLELAGPPWVKEGIVIHKHHLDGVDKKAKDRNWTEVFAVIQKGTISIFSFTPNKSTGRRNRNVPKKGGVVGGGNWQENATTLGTWSLRLTLASALPSPGYSKQRPHVWALSLPTGAVHLFHVGTAEICNEFVTTANYWSARLSTHPLVGGVSNMEYGWSENIVNNALVTAINETNVAAPAGRQRSGSVAGRTSTHSRTNSFRSVSSFDFGSTNPRTGGLNGSNKLPGDRVTISEWTPPTQSMRCSNLPEHEQVETLMTYLKSIEDDLQQHNGLRSPMLLAFSPRGGNGQRAMANWERKSSYLLHEIVKFRTYVDVLRLAETRKAEIYKERDIARRAARGSLDGISLEAKELYELGDGEPERGRWRGDQASQAEADGDDTLRA